MKYIESAKLNDKELKEKCPVFETVDEYLAYTAKASEDQIKNYAIKIYLDSFTEATKLYYGQKYLLEQCETRARKELDAVKANENKLLLDKAKPAKAGYILVKKKNFLSFNDKSENNVGVFADISVANELVNKLQKEGKDTNFEFINEKGQNVDLPKKYVDYNEEYNTFF